MLEYISEITVQGTSMNPRLKAGDIVTISPQSQYAIGDIVLFPYKDEGLIIHRIVKIENGSYFCKGDNSFRLEQLEYGQIQGKATFVSRGDQKWEIGSDDKNEIEKFCNLSLKVHYIALRAQWNMQKIRQDETYQLYEKEYLKPEDAKNHTLVFQMLRALYGKGEFDTMAIRQNLSELLTIFRYHDILELLSSIPLLDEAVYANAKLRRSVNQASHQLRLALMQPVFDEIPFPYAVIKGLALARMAYTNESYRCSTDVDLLIDRVNVKRMEDILRQNGFIQGRVNSQGEIVAYTREERLFYLTTSHQTAPFIKLTDDRRMPYLCVDINFKIVWGEYEGNAIGINEFLTDREWLACDTYHKGGFFTLTPEKTLIQYCLHNYKEINSLYLLTIHNSISLRGFCDVYGLIKKCNLNMKKVAEIAEQYHIQNYLYTVLYFTAKVFDDPDLLCFFNDIDLLDDPNQFGLTKAERKTWPVNFEERLFSQNRLALIQPLLTKAEQDKIQANKRYL